jgi:hypothetical protein
MTNTAELAVELTQSYAHRVGDAVHLVVQLSDQLASSDPTTLQLRNGQRVVRIPVSLTTTPIGTALDATVGTTRLRPGTWKLALADESQRPTGLEARLVYSKKQPVALLPGPVPSTALAPPHPKRARPSLRRRLYTAAARAADAGLRALPEEPADRCRSLLKKAARPLRG